jgi:hypothetical protein
MPRYFFHVQDGERIPDEEGLILPGPDAARKEAVVAAGEMLKDSAAKVWTGEDWRMSGGGRSRKACLRAALHGGNRPFRAAVVTTRFSWRGPESADVVRAPWRQCLMMPGACCA